MMSSVDMEMEDIFEEQDENDLDADIGIPDLDIEVPDVSQTQALTQTQGKASDLITKTDREGEEGEGL